jgi:hypothetical protein
MTPDRTDEDRAEQAKGRIREVGKAYYDANGIPTLTGWFLDGGPYGVRYPVAGPDDPCVGGWTFRELHAIANGVGEGIEAVDRWPEDAGVVDAYTVR